MSNDTIKSRLVMNREEQDKQYGQSKTYADMYFEQELERLGDIAQELIDEYWDCYWTVKKNRPRSEWGYIGVRLQRRDNGLSIEWFRMQFRQGYKQPHKIHIPRGKNYSYLPSAFRRARAKDWEMAKAMELEKKFGIIRRNMKMLSQMRRYYNEYRKVDLAGLLEM